MKRVVKGLVLLALSTAMASVSGCRCNPEGTDSGVDGGPPPDGGTCDNDGMCEPPGETFMNCPNDCAPPAGMGCEPLEPGDPIVPGGLGACCEGEVVGNPTAECMAPLGCLNGYCTLLACGDDGDCVGEVEMGDRSPFPVGTTFGCVQGPPANAAINYCAPIGASRRECGGPAGTTCAAGETCVMAWDPDDTFGGLCMTDISRPASIPSPGIGEACHLSSNRPCTTNGDCRTIGGVAIEECDVVGGTCVLASPYNKYQCSGTEGAAEFVRPGVFMVTGPFTGPGGFTNWEGGCFAGFFGGPGTCEAMCDPANPNCPGGMTCARWDTFSDGNIGICVQQECLYDFGPMVPDAVNGAVAVNPPACTVDADCAGFAGGAFGSRCLDTDANGIDDTCEVVDRVTLCGPGFVCAHHVFSDKVDQMTTNPDQTEFDTFEGYCVPEMLGDAGTLGALGDPCEDRFDCLSGVCTRGDVYDPTTPGSPVATIGTCTEVCFNDSNCAGATGGPQICAALTVFGGTTAAWPICLPADVLFGIEYCTGDDDCAAAGLVNNGCAIFTFRTGVGICNERIGVLASENETGTVTGLVDEEPNGAICRNDIFRCLPGDDDVEDSTVADANAGVCTGDDVAASGSNNCASGLCLDADDITGGMVDGPAVCSGVCANNSDCAGPQVCTGFLFNDNSTDDAVDNTSLGLCITMAPVMDPCNDNGTAPLNDAECVTDFGTTVSVGTVLGCDDTTPVPGSYAETFPGFGIAGERDSGACYNTVGTIGSPCVDDRDCNIGGRCILDDGSGMPVNNFTAGYCVQDGCAFDPMTGIGAALNPADCPTGFDGGNGNTDVICGNGGAVGICFKACSADADCRNGGTEYTCQELIMGNAMSMACLPPAM